MPTPSEAKSLEQIRLELEAVLSAIDTSSMGSARRKELLGVISRLSSDLALAQQQLDPIAQPESVFDPSNPKVVGRFVSLALVAQPRLPLIDVTPAYGSGIYAIYYTGEFVPYLPISGSETPIYVGQAGPLNRGARNSVEQGPRLTRRLQEHRVNIARASSTLAVEDFTCRSLVVASGAETAAENYLIHLFRPVWNNETGIAYGLGKHGDSAETRANKRSPWDTLHPGRTWAGKSTQDAKSRAEILAELERHFQLHPAYKDLSSLLEGFLDELRQV